MKKQNHLEENNVRKEALTMTAIFIVLTVIMEIVALVFLSWASEHIGPSIISTTGFIHAEFVCLLVCLDIVFAIAVYFDFKKVVIEYQKRMEEMKQKTE